MCGTEGSSSTVYGWVDAADVKEVVPAIVKGSRVKVAKGAKTYNGGSLASYVYTTTYTVIKRLCGKGCLKNENAIVTSLVDRATVQQADGQEVLQRSFNGSLPNFLAAFLRAGSVSDQEAAQLEELLEEYKNR